MDYDRELEWNEPPTRSEQRYARWTVVRAVDRPAPSWWPLARIGAVDLYVAPPGREEDAPAASVTPLVAAKRGGRGTGDYAGVDGCAQTDRFDPSGATGGPPPLPPHRPPVRTARSHAVRVAVIDVSFEGLARLPAPVDGPIRVGLPDVEAENGDPDPRPAAPGLGHGTAMAGVVLAQLPTAHVGLFQIESAAGAARPYLAAADLAAAVAAAVEGWLADVVLIAMSEGAWGTPRYLRDVLREAAHRGRGGRGAAIFCSVGDPSSNHARQNDSPALGADDLASQPWVLAIAACDRRGRWYRVYPGYACPGGAGAGGATYNRLGPAVALAALGEPTSWSPHVASDDSSQASALAAAAAAGAIEANPGLSLTELRALLALTADVPAATDGGRGLAAGAFDGRDRLGHSLKIGYGVVNARAARPAATDPVGLAFFATRPVPDDGAGASGPPAGALGKAWRSEVGRAARRGSPLARAYLRLAPRLSRLFLSSLAVQDALCWLSRHVRALAEQGDLELWRGQHHGALVERIRHALDTSSAALPAEEAATATALHALEAALAAPDAAAVVATVVATILARTVRPAVMAADGGRGKPRDIAVASGAVGNRRGRHGPGRADRRGQPQRAALARADVPRSVHRSPR